MRLLGRFQRVSSAVGELRRDARHHADEPHPGEVADLERHHHQLLFGRHLGPRGEACQRRADDPVGVGRRRGGRHFQRHQGGQIIDRRDHQPFADTPGRRVLAHDRQDGGAGAERQQLTLLDRHALLFEGIVGHGLFDFGEGFSRQGDEPDEHPFLLVLEAGEGRGGLELVWRDEWPTFEPIGKTASAAVAGCGAKASTTAIATAVSDLRTGTNME